ncbi:MAG: hypothetical protein RI900_64 [Actinomycetota bacterium]|jgi:Protein of unknown function (DUF2505)
MRVRHRGLFPAPPSVVFEAFTSPDLIVAKYHHLGHVDVRIIESRQQFGVVTIRSRREVPTSVPEFATRFFRPMTVVEENEEWDPLQPDGSRNGTWQVTARGVPVTAGGVQRLVPRPDGTSERVVEGEVVCPMPGEEARLAELVLADIERKLDDEDLFINRWLADRLNPSRSELG